MSFAVFDLIELGDGVGPEDLDRIKTKTGCARVLFGRKQEDKRIGVVLTQWESADTAWEFSRNKDRFPGDTGDGNESRVFEVQPAMFGEDGGGSVRLEKVLRAPCVEVFTAFQAQDGFGENVERFLRAMDVEEDKPKGYHGGVVLLQKGDVKGGEGKVYRALLGWDSVEAHSRAKGEEGGVIGREIWLLRERRGAVDLFHVEFKEV
ncbi:hypothetical protein QBC47DRAFT_157363 [Echria macrotheca]|uniref:ABM domain-containing protein n=1 Tax=Echria macrotheca TaxID=438768 RepID=A0AAJ0BFV6_9PEZI|nr:hypothetical protein QBC47DRAFT_157363 [Echria macrotheca]